MDKLAAQRIELEVTAYHEAGHAVMLLAHGRLIQYVSILPEHGMQVGGTKARQDPGPLAPEDGSVNMEMLRVAVGGPIAEELLTGIGYGTDRLKRSDYEVAHGWASRDHELPHDVAMSHVHAAWAEAEAQLKRRWSHVVILAEALLRKYVLSGAEVVDLLLDAVPVPWR